MAWLYSRLLPAAADPGKKHQSGHAGQHRDERHERLRVGPDDGCQPRRVAVLGGHGPLHLGEVGRPVAEGQAERQSEDDPDPVTHRVGPSEAGARPRVDEGGPVLGLERAEEAAQASALLERDDRQRHHPDHDHEELHDLVVDGAGQATEQDVGQHEGRRQHDRQQQRDPEQRLEDDGECVEVHAGDEDAAEHEGDRVDQVRLRVEPQPEVLGDAAHLGPVVERHHHDAEEHHRGDRADPEVVHHRGAVLGPAGGLAEQLDGTDVGRDEADPGDPGGQGPTGQEEVQRGLHATFQGETDAEDEAEVDHDQHDVDRAQVEIQVAGRRCVDHVSPR